MFYSNYILRRYQMPTYISYLPVVNENMISAAQRDVENVHNTEMWTR